MSFATVANPSAAWTPDRDSVLSFTDGGSIYASLQRPQHPIAKYIPQQDIYSKPPPLPGGPHPGRKDSFVSLRSVNESANSIRRNNSGRYHPRMTAGAGGDCGMGRDIIEVQILPQDDNWGDNTTAITGNTSVRSESFQELSIIGKDPDENKFKLHRYVGCILTGLVCLFAFFSPIAMVLIPHMDLIEMPKEQLNCDSECDGLFISASFKLIILLLGSWALFFRKPKATMPRIFIFRSLICVFIFVFTFSYWLFYAVRIIDNRDQVNYRSIVYFALSLVDTLLFIHYLAVIFIELRHLSPQYSIKILRSPDGLSRWYNIGQLSVQRAAVWVLEKYYQDFPIYNPYLDRVPAKKKNQNSINSSFKYYDVDGNNDSADGRARAVLAATARRRDSAHNERFYEEAEYERRVRKRKARLLTAAEEAFTHIRRLHEDIGGTGAPMNPHEAAQAIFPSLARALQKYLRITRQQPRHSMEAILQHLATCLSHDMSPRAFLEKYLKAEPILQNDREGRSTQEWGLVCDQLLSRPITSGTVFQLRQNDILLLCYIQDTPHFSIAEEIIHPKSNKFVLRLNSETSV